MHDHILLPTNGSPETKRAITYAVAVADEVGATIHALYIIKELVYNSYDDDEEKQTELKRDGRDALEEVRIAASPTDVPVETELRYGPPTKEILTASNYVNADMIVMGTQGRTSLDRVLMGSLAESVSRQAAVPVVTIKAHNDSPSIETSDAAIELAQDTIERAGYEITELIENPIHSDGSWIVPLRCEIGSFRVHIDAFTGTSRIVKIY